MFDEEPLDLSDRILYNSAMLISMALLGLSSLLSANAATPDFQGTIRSLLSCAYNNTVSLDGSRFAYKWANLERNPYFVASCTSLEAERNQIVFFSSDSVSTFSFKEPKPYKGGMEQSLYRLQLDQQTYYFREDITGGMDALYDQNGSPLYPNRDPIDVSSKNVVLTYFMQQMLGKTNSGGSIAVTALPSSQEAFAQDCLVKNIQWLAHSLMGQFITTAGKGADPASLAQLQGQLTRLFKQENCSADASLRQYLDQTLRVIDLVASGRIKIIYKRNGLSSSTQYSGSQEDVDEYSRLNKILGN